ncbi:hypothetical protein [Dyella telluris]|uniref:Uncharacterized protein n=1 Tax=Dyella telluris TaxID=2763498 RepID=A0A7G8Q4I6_9GAMM|nr:hypothetical protein [Dyella telluris]QNK01694.1 hypothetical protein H8F01_00495 [Dyella telluris]
MNEQQKKDQLLMHGEMVRNMTENELRQELAHHAEEVLMHGAYLHQVAGMLAKFRKAKGDEEGNVQLALLQDLLRPIVMGQPSKRPNDLVTPRIDGIAEEILDVLETFDDHANQGPAVEATTSVSALTTEELVAELMKRAMNGEAGIHAVAL